MSYPIYHCGRCGSLFPAELGRNDRRVCVSCKQSPETGEWPVENGEDPQEESAGGERPPETPEGKTHRESIRRRGSRPIAWIVAVWLLLMGLALWMHRMDSERGLREANRARQEAYREREKAALLAAALPECHKTLLGFLDANGLEERSRFVADPLATARKMADFHSTNPFPRMDPVGIARIGQELIPVDGEWMVVTRWDDAAEGTRFDAVFRLEAGQWLLDWEHFARYSTCPWTPFLEGEGPEEGEFRLLAREIPREDEEERISRHLRFELLSPDAAATDPIVSPQLVVDRLSEEGLLLGAAFAAKLEGGGPFGGALKSMEPEGWVRVRVVVKRIDFGGVRKFEVQRITACHWITSDSPGFDLNRLKDEAFGPI